MEWPTFLLFKFAKQQLQMDDTSDINRIKHSQLSSYGSFDFHLCAAKGYIT